MFKLYLINEREAFFGYSPLQEHTIELNGEPTPIWDLMGKDTVPFHHSADEPESMAAQYVEQSRMWFDSIWNTVAQDLKR